MLGDDDPGYPSSENISPQDPTLDQPAHISQRMLRELVDRISYAESLINELRADKDNLRAITLTQSEQIKELETKYASTATKSPELQMPDPPNFFGDRRTLLPFLTKCRLKFLGQPSMFSTELAKVMYAGSRLEGPPFAWFSPLSERLHNPDESNPDELRSFDAFASALTTLYGDPDLSHTAERSICMLRQTTSVAVYIAEFEQHRQYLSWNDQALRDQFYFGLKERIKDHMAPLGRPDTLTAMKDVALRFDARLNARHLERQASGSNPSTTRASAPATRPPAVQQTVSTPIPSTPNPPPAATPARLNIPAVTADGTVPMELGSRQGWHLTPAEKQRRKELGLCNYCGGPGHRAFNCPKAPPSRSQGQAVMNIDISDPSTIAPSPSPSNLSVVSLDTPPSENSYARE